MEGARLLRGGRALRVPAPPGRLPLLLRAGTILPLLPAGVDTLSARRTPRPRRSPSAGRQLRLLAFPRGASAGTFLRHGRILSREGPGGWALRIAGAGARSYELQASMRTLRRPFAPCAMTSAAVVFRDPGGPTITAGACSRPASAAAGRASSRCAAAR